MKDVNNRGTEEECGIPKLVRVYGNSALSSSFSVNLNYFKK